MTTGKIALSLDWLVHAPARLGLMMMLAESPRSFTEICDGLELTKGNTAHHIAYLEDVEYVNETKHRKPSIHSIYNLTPDGRIALTHYFEVASLVTNKLATVLTFTSKSLRCKP